MKPVLFLATPPLAFIAAAILAGLVPPNDDAHGANHLIPAGPRKLAEAMKVSQSAATDIPSQLAEMERQIIHFPSPEVAIHDGNGMEACLINDEHSLPVCGAGMSAISYALEWAQENPAAMFEWLNQHWTASGNQRQSMAATLFSEWARQDMAAALAAIPSITHAESRAQALVSTLEVLFQKDPAKAREILLQNLDSLEALKRAQFGYEAGKARTEFLQALPPGRIRSLFMAENIENLITFGPEENKTLATGLWNQCSIGERRAMVAAGFSPGTNNKTPLPGLMEPVRENAESTNDPEKIWRFLYEYGEFWAERDPNGALAWTMAHLKGKERTDQCLRLVKHAASKDFDAAIKAWQSLPEGSLRDRAAKILTEAAPADRTAEKELLEQATSNTQGSGAW